MCCICRFWVSWRSGVIQVGSGPLYSHVILSWQFKEPGSGDPMPFPINALSTGSLDSEAEWELDQFNRRLPWLHLIVIGADPGFLKRGGVLFRSTSKGGPWGGPILDPMLKRLHSGPKRGVRSPWTPPTPIRPCVICSCSGEGIIQKPHCHL